MTSTFLRSRPLLAAALLLAAGLTACGGGKDKAASQSAVRVNNGEITVHQINQVLEQQRGLKPEQLDAAGREVLERLIDQELAVQQAESQKLDRSPRVVAAIEVAKREIIARAYHEKLGETVAKPTPEEVQAYFDGKPALFANRRVYNLQELSVEVPSDRRAEVQNQLSGARNAAAMIDWLKAQGLRFAANQTAQAAESLPLNLVDQLATLGEGQSLVQPTPNGVRVLIVAGARLAPVALAQAAPAIEQFILNDRKRAAVQSGIKDLRGRATIEYLGKFAAPAVGAAAASAPASVANPAQPDAPASAGLDDAALKKGLGLK
jgi:EpsD family peptidyl-prolyl cis-trans isomerase